VFVGVRCAVAAVVMTGCAGPWRAVEIAAGSQATCARGAEGRVRCWGASPERVRGAGGAVDVAERAVAVGGVDDAVSIAVGDDHACAARATGAVSCWGAGFERQLGDGTQRDHSSPVAVAGLGDAVAVVAGAGFSCARRRAGAVVCWGDNGVGQLGDGTTASRAAPVAVAGVTDAEQLAASGSNGAHVCARRASRAAWCWGADADGQLGRDETAAWGAPAPVVGVADARALAAGGGHSCAVVAGGRVMCWGANGDGQLGDGTTDRRPVPVTVVDLPDAVAVAAGLAHTCAIRGAGAVVCWGRNSDGQLGDGTRGDPRARPAPVPGLDDAAALALGAHHTCALRRTGAVVCWGANDRGQLGDGMRAARATPVPVIFPPP
jgi:alpha-tubulin suppressor-like RCC1 family protein